MSYAGQLWTDDDFKCCKVDEYSGDIEADIAMERAARGKQVLS